MVFLAAEQSGEVSRMTYLVGRRALPQCYHPPLNSRCRLFMWAAIRMVESTDTAI
jgi:hypothetical protein